MSEIHSQSDSRVCKACGETKTLSEFHLSGGRYKSKCKACICLYAKEAYAKSSKQIEYSLDGRIRYERVNDRDWIVYFADPRALADPAIKATRTYFQTGKADLESATEVAEDHYRNVIVPEIKTHPLVHLFINRDGLPYMKGDVCPDGGVFDRYHTNNDGNLVHRRSYESWPINPITGERMVKGEKRDDGVVFELVFKTAKGIQARFVTDATQAIRGQYERTNAEGYTVKLWLRTRDRAEKNAWGFDIGKEWLYNEITRTGRCAISGIPFTFAGLDDADIRLRPFSPSIDRIDSKGGYTKDNVRIVLAALNIAFGEWGEKIAYAIFAAILNPAHNKDAGLLPTSVPEFSANPFKQNDRVIRRKKQSFGVTSTQKSERAKQ